MKRKILTFIVSNGQILALHGKPHPQHDNGGWFVVTGGVEENETYEGAVAREILEETGLIAEEVFSLNWGSIYPWKGDICEEHNFISFVKPRKISLNEEHSKYEWLDVDEFIERIKWGDNKELLRKVLENALNKKQYFKKLEIKDYREKKNE